MEIAYWIVVGLLGVLYLYSGGRKLGQSKEALAPIMGWVDTVPMPVVRLVGLLEVLGILGLVLPPLTGIAPVLALVAALGLLVLQVLAAALHLSRGEVRLIGLNVALIVLAGVAAWLSASW